MHKAHMTAAPRRLLPSISLLQAFEAVCRTGSTAAAARELALTQGAVSRLVQGLEGQLGVQLFQRDRRRLVPTEAAQVYARDVRKALDLIARSSLGVRSNPGGGVLSLAILPTFGTRWLAPRLPAFLTAHPGITINLATRLRPFDFAREGFDAAIHFGRDDWQGAGAMKLFDERLIATCSPDFLRRNPVSGPGDLASLPLLQLETRPDAWAQWFSQHGIEGATPARGMMFDQFATMTQAAIAGVGLALLPAFLAAGEIAEGRLVRACGTAATGVGSYWLVWPETGAGHPPLQAFRAWLGTITAPLRGD
ncbi:LysR family transcriptional regulator [Plastorhodobacter daqingensis]|uniref:LysR family transcriptional regulator n=1 Tax=Plastorhodobacter daqingensis TaxID=1387281 RepID=A0ABW2UN00_9RHOB